MSGGCERSIVCGTRKKTQAIKKGMKYEYLIPRSVFSFQFIREVNRFCSGPFQLGP